jgi:serine/threonine protein kinase/tetratricopeptide (TPR) repeat protein
MIGTTVSHYKIVDKLGAGGMGEVFLAEDTKLDRKVALKFLPSALWNESEAQQRLIREAKAASKLDHPNIVTIHGIEEHEGRPFIIMAHVQGANLKEYCTAQHRSMDELIDLVLQMADGLQHAHEAGVVHRDLKPSNVIVDDTGRARVLDFGIASLRGAAKLTQTGSTIGTIAYAPPELAQGKEATAASDVYSLGVVTYQMLSGKLPFEADHEAALLYSILNDAPKPLTESNPDVTTDIQQIVSKCLEKDPDKRFESCAELAISLKKSITPASKASGNGNDKPSIAVLPFTNMSADPENEYFSDGLTEELLNVLARNPKLKVTGRTSSFAFKGKQEDLREIGQKLGVKTLLEGSVRKAGNRVRITTQLVKVSDGFHLWSDTYDRVVDDIFAVQDEIAQSVSSAMNVTLLGQQEPKPAVNMEAYNLMLQAHHVGMRNTGEALAKALELLKKALELDPDNARAWAELSRTYKYYGGFGFMDNEEARTKSREAAETAVRLDPNEPKAYEALGNVLLGYEFQWQEAGKHLRKAHQLAPSDSRIHSALANYEAVMGNLKEAARLARAAIDLEPLSAHAHLSLGKMLLWSGDPLPARTCFEKALDLSPDITLGHIFLGVCYKELGDNDRAMVEASKEKSDGYRLTALVGIYFAAGKIEESDRALAELMQCGEEWAIQIALCHAGRNESDQTFQWLERAYELHDSGLGVIKPHPAFDSIRSDPRYPAFLKKIGLTA